MLAFRHPLQLTKSPNKKQDLSLAFCLSYFVPTLIRLSARRRAT